MDAKRVEVLHVTDRDAAVGRVADHLELYLLPALEGLLDEYLGGEGESLGAEFLQFGVIVHEAGAEAAEGIRRAKDERIAEVARGGLGLLEVLGRMRPDGQDTYLVEPFYEKFAVLGVHYGLDGRTEHLDSVFLKHSAAVQVDAAVEGGLASEGQKYALGPLLRDDLLHEERRDRQEINPVGYAFRSLHGRDVRVDEDRLDPVLAQGLESLCAGVIEFSCLADLECARAEQENLPDC